MLRLLGVEDFEICPAKGEEQMLSGLSPAEQVIRLSQAKAREVSSLLQTEPIRDNREPLLIAADTVVSVDGEILGKPKDEDDTRRMLRRLSGREHEVFTGMTVLCSSETYSAAERTIVRFRTLREREIDAYVATGEPMDKAGAYAAQGRGSLFVESVKGDFFNVVGLPLCRLSLMLERFGVFLL